MTTLIVSSWLPNGTREIAKAAESAHWQVVCLEGRPVPSRLRDSDIAYYGATDVAQQVALRLSLALLEPTLDCLVRLPRKYLLREVRFGTVADARRLTSRAFVKPADNSDKCFDSGVYPGGWAIPCQRGFPESTPVVISENVSWDVEYRCFVLEGEIVTCSPYVRYGRWMKRGDSGWLAPETEVRQIVSFSREMFADKKVRLPPAVTIDIGKIEGRGWALVELNPVWSSGLYGCNAVSVLPALRRACVRKAHLKDSDRPWVIARERSGR